MLYPPELRGHRTKSMAYRRLLLEELLGVTKSVTIVRHYRLAESLSGLSQIPI